MDYKCTYEMYSICENNSKCYLCDGERLYKRPKWMTLKEKELERKKSHASRKKKEGMSFEKKVAKKYNKAVSPKKDIARRRPNSGAIWSMPGDIVTERELIECKERGTTTSKGERTISIPESHLNKIKEEAYLAKRNVWYYIFGYKGSDNIYLVKDYEDELRMIQQIEILKDRIKELENQL